ncbi:phage tail spike protein [Virgibacillus litoralis]|uniref:Phage minor structural protein n=1 Tax=Virgibacillus litoralis TaxID=578221 RepID=A0ABS4HHI5_9BACI|nr:phage tail spike protein [Virgibacillus litoralis]MBP1950303.1 phage minor structural protein [Virgibacillus litoralis]
MSIIHITDGQNGIIKDDIPAKYIISNMHRQSLKDTLETFNFTTFADKRFSPHLGKQNRVIIPGEDGELREFVIQESIKTMDKQMEVYASATYLLLKKAKVIYPQTLTGQTPSTAMAHALDGTGWLAGTIEGGGSRTFNIDTHTNPYSLLKRIATDFDLELRFRVVTDGNRVIGRYVDLLEQVGQWRGREVTLGKDLLGIKRKEKTGNIYTALVGLGPEQEDGTRLEVTVTDEDALQRWGEPDKNGDLQHLIGTYEPQSTDQDMTLNKLTTLTESELEKRVNEVVEYESDIADLEHVPGMENKKIRFGDTIKIKDTKFSPPLYLEARVHTQDRSITDKSKKKVVLGDYTEYTEEDVMALWRNLRKQVAFKIGQTELADYTYTKTSIDDKDGVIYTDSTSYAFNQAQNAQSNAEQYAYDNYESVKNTVNNNRDMWDKASVFNVDGTLNVGWLSGQLTDDQIQSAGTWNGQGTYIDENGVYTGVVVASQIVADSLSAVSANLGEVTAGSLTSNTTIDVTTDLSVGKTIYMDKAGFLDGRDIYYGDGTVDVRFRFETSGTDIHNVYVGGTDAYRVRLAPYGFVEVLSDIDVEGTGYFRVASNPASGQPLFQVLSSGASERLRVEHNGTTSTTNNFHADGNLSIGGSLSGTLSGGTLRPGNIFATGTVRSDGNGLYSNNAGRFYNSGDGITYLQGDDEIRATHYLSSTLAPIRASDHWTGSLEENKQDIVVWQESALDLINNSTIHEYRLISDVEAGKDILRQGLVIGYGYATPAKIIAPDGEAVSQYGMSSWAWKAIQEISTLYYGHDERINYLEMSDELRKAEIKDLKARVEQLEGAA